MSFEQPTVQNPESPREKYTLTLSEFDARIKNLEEDGAVVQEAQGADDPEYIRSDRRKQLEEITKQLKEHSAARQSLEGGDLGPAAQLIIRQELEAIDAVRNTEGDQEYGAHKRLEDMTQTVQLLRELNISTESLDKIQNVLDKNVDPEVVGEGWRRVKEVEGLLEGLKADGPLFNYKSSDPGL